MDKSTKVFFFFFLSAFGIIFESATDQYKMHCSLPRAFSKTIYDKTKLQTTITQEGLDDLMFYKIWPKISKQRCG